MLLVPPIGKAPPDRLLGIELPDGSTSRYVTSATAWVVAPGILVTNRHALFVPLFDPDTLKPIVVKKGDVEVPATGRQTKGFVLMNMNITTPNGALRVLANMLAETGDENRDLALLTSDDPAMKDVPSLPINCEFPKNDVQSRYIGYARFRVPLTSGGFQVQTPQLVRRARITATIAGPDFARSSILFDPETMAGNSGSPLFKGRAPFEQQTWEVIGIVQANILKSGYQGLGLAIPSFELVKFLKEKKVDYTLAGDPAACDPFQ